MEGAQKAASDEVIHGKDGGNGKFLNPTPMLDELEKKGIMSFNKDDRIFLARK